MLGYEIVGKTFGRLTVIESIGNNKHNHKLWLCKCSCGNEKITTTSSLTNNITMSCGCYRKENTAKRGKSNTTHGLTKDPLYKTWRHMVDRCTDENDEAYHHYGGRGIKVCDEWLKSPKNFIRDMGPKPSPYHTLDRKNNDDGYNPNNCRWVTPFEQSRNTRRNIKYLYKGQLYIVADLAKKLNVSAHMLKYRLEQKKMTLEEALSDLYLVKRRRTMSVEPYFIITKYSHFFSVTNIQPSAIGTILKFSAKYVHKTYVRENGKNVLKPNKVFATRIANREFRFHIGQYEDFIKFISYENLTPEYYEVVVKPMYESATFKSKVNPKFEEREYQTKLINFLVNEEIGDNRSRLVGLQTGQGKTFCSLSAVSKLTTRTMIVVLGRYMQKWTSDVSEILNVDPKEIIVVQGGEMLKSLMFLSTEQEIQAKFIVVSLTTLQNLYNDFRDNGDGLLDMEFPYLPDELCERLKIGTIIFDEAHQHLYGVYRTLLHTHVPKVIALTATLISDDPFIDYMQHVMFPKEIRYNKVPINKYVKIKSYSYGFKNRDIIKRIRTSTRGSNTYNQIEFEKSLVRIPPLLKSYLDLIVRLVKMDYIDNRLEGDKAMVFAGSIDMCTRITERLKKEFPYLDVRRYVEDDPYENAIEADIRVSTVLSGGTAIDIPNLRTALMTNSIQSPVSNLQALGRLRQLKDRDVTFSYMVNFHIPKQVDYHNRKKELFADRAVSFKELRIDEGI